MRSRHASLPRRELKSDIDVCLTRVLDISTSQLINAVRSRPIFTSYCKMASRKQFRQVF